MQVSMVPTGPPRQGKKGFMVAGALVASSSSTAFLAASFMAPPIAPIMLAILNRIGRERKQGENAEAKRLHRDSVIWGQKRQIITFTTRVCPFSCKIAQKKLFLCLYTPAIPSNHCETVPKSTSLQSSLVSLSVCFPLLRLLYLLATLYLPWRVQDKAQKHAATAKSVNHVSGSILK